MKGICKDRRKKDKQNKYSYNKNRQSPGSYRKDSSNNDSHRRQIQKSYKTAAEATWRQQFSYPWPDAASGINCDLFRWSFQRPRGGNSGAAKLRPPQWEKESLQEHRFGNGIGVGLLTTPIPPRKGYRDRLMTTESRSSILWQRSKGWTVFLH